VQLARVQKQGRPGRRVPPGISSSLIASYILPSRCTRFDTARAGTCGEFLLEISVLEQFNTPSLQGRTSGLTETASALLRELKRFNALLGPNGMATRRNGFRLPSPSCRYLRGENLVAEAALRRHHRDLFMRATSPPGSKAATASSFRPVYAMHVYFGGGIDSLSSV